MREKLIELAYKAGLGATPEDEVYSILAELRCDHCKHWGRYGLCGVVADQNGYKIPTENDFFCSKWEPNTNASN